MSIKMINDDFSSRLKKARLNKQLSQRDLAKQAGLDPAQISRYEAGKNIPRENIAHTLAKILDTSIEWLLYGRAQPPQLPLERDDSPYREFALAAENLLTVVIKEQAAHVYDLSGRISNPFTRFEMRKAELLIKQSRYLLERGIYTLNLLGIAISKMEDSISEHENEYLLMKKLGKLEDYYQKQRKNASDLIGSNLPPGMALQLLNLSTKEDAEAIFTEFQKWYSKISEKEHAHAIVNLMLKHLSEIAEITASSSISRETIKRINVLVGEFEMPTMPQ